MKIRQAKPEEAEELTKIALGAKGYWEYPQHWLDLWREDLTFTAEIIENNIVILLESDNEILGFYKLVLEDKIADLEHLWIKPSSIGKGVGKKLFLHAKEKAISLNAKTLTIKSDPNAEGFYAKMGAVTVSEDVSELEGKERKLPLMEINL